MPDTVDLLVLAAHPSELAGLPLPGEVRRHGGRSVATAVVGVGMPAAGGGTARALTGGPRAALLLGSCGSFQALPALALTVGHTARLLDAAEREGHAAHPEAMPTRAAMDASLADGLCQVHPDAARVEVGTTPGITTDDALAARLAAAGCEVENLEGLAVALACRDAGVPMTSLLVVTNPVGARGRADWARHREEAARRGGAAVLQWLEAGAPGLRG